MKTQILKLEIHDDIVSIQDKLAWKQTGRILLVFPEGRDGGLHKRLNRRLDLLLLKRAARRLGAQIAFLTHNISIQKTAQRIGIPVFENINQAHTARWMVYHFHKPSHLSIRRYTYARDELEEMREDLYPRAVSSASIEDKIQTSPRIYTRVIWLVCVLLALSGIAWLCTVPRLEIYLTPTSEMQAINLPVKASTLVKTSQVNGVIPAKRFSVIVESREQEPVSGTMLAPVEKSRGEVVFHNLTTHSIIIPAGTHLTSSQADIQFVTTRTEELPASYIKKENSVSSATIPVLAVFAGSQSNLPVASIDTVLGELAPNLTVTNPSPTYGGMEMIVPCPTGQDRRKLGDRVAQHLKVQARSELEKAVNLSGNRISGYLLTNEPEIARVIEERFIPDTNDTPSHTIEYVSRLEYQAWGVTGTDLMSIAAKAADDSMPAGFKPVVDTLEISHATSPRPIGDITSVGRSFEWSIFVSRKIYADIHEETLSQDLIFHSLKDISQILKDNLSLEKNPRFVLSPGWLPFLPFLPGQYIVINTVS